MRSDAVGVVLRDVVVYIDDSSAQGGAGVEVSAKFAECTGYMHCRYQYPCATLTPPEF